MQPNQIVLPVDELNNGTPVNETLTRFEEYLNRSVYVSNTHTVASRDTLTFYRTFPKANGNFKGVSKISFKLSRDITVDGVDGISTIAAPVIVEVSFSLPVGITDAQALVCRQRTLALLDLDSVMVPFSSQLMI